MTKRSSRENPSFESQVPATAKHHNGWTYPQPIKVPMKERLRRMKDERTHK